MAITLVLTKEMAEALLKEAGGHLETAGVLLVSIVAIEDSEYRILVRELHWLPETAYVTRSQKGMKISSVGYVGFLRRAEEIHATPIWLHTHPGKGVSPNPSIRDKRVDDELMDLFKLRSGSSNYGAVILSTTGGALGFTGHINYGGSEHSIDRIWIVGDRFSMRFAKKSNATNKTRAMFDRNIRAFGGDIQETLNQLKIAVVGCGGIGSAVAEQLGRLGVRNFLLIDPDQLSVSNLTRVYGATTSSIGKNKAEVLARHLQCIDSEMNVRFIATTINVLATARELRGCDLVYGCTDDNAGRLVLSRFAFYYLTPVIDCGVILTSDPKDMLTGIYGRVTILSPGSACLLCRGRIDLKRAYAQLLNPEERHRLQDEGYAPALGEIEPAVITYTTLVASVAVGELIERLVGYGPLPVPSEIIIRCHDRLFSTNIEAPKVKHYCHRANGKLGLGDSEPYLELIWGK